MRSIIKTITLLFILSRFTVFAAQPRVGTVSGIVEVVTAANGMSTNQSLVTPTLTSPTIGDFSNSQHNHQNSQGGGVLDAAALGSGTLDIARLPVAASGVSDSTKLVRSDDSRLSTSGSQAVWTHDQDAGGFSLTNVFELIFSGTNAGTVLFGDSATGTNGYRFSATSTQATNVNLVLPDRPLPGLWLSSVASATNETISKVTTGAGLDSALGTTGTADSTTFYRGDHTYSKVQEANVLLADNTTNNASTSSHGYMPKADGVATHVYKGDGSQGTLDAATIASGTLDIARLPVAASGVSDSTKIVRSDDSRLNSGGSATNAVSSISSNSTVIASSVTNLAFWGFNMTNRSGIVDITAPSGGSGGNWTSVGTTNSSLQGVASSYSLQVSNITSKLVRTDSQGNITNVNVTSNLVGTSASFDGTNLSVTPGITHPSYRRTTLVMANGSGSPNAMGDAVSSGGTGAASGANASSTEGATVNYQATSGSGNIFGLSGNLLYRTGRHLVLSASVKLVENANERVWICLTDQAQSTQGASDTPVGNYAAFLYSTAIGSVWQTTTRDGTTQTTKATTVTADTSVHQFVIIFDDTNSRLLFYIDSILVNTHASSDNPPSSGTALRYDLCVTTTESVAKNVKMEWLTIGSDR